MTDIVRVFEKYATDKGYTYNYGDKYAMNLIEQGYNWSGNETDVYFLHEFRRGTKVDFNTMKYSGTFYLLVHSDMNQNFFQEVGTIAEGKYENNIEPLIQLYGDIEKYYFCTDLQIISSSFIDVTDFLDANTDGIKVDYTVQYINSYEGT